MASKNIVAKGTTYNGVESVTFPVSGGGDATFYEISDTTCTATDVLNSKYFYTSSGVKTQGTGTAPSPTLITKSITANGTYDAEDDDADGYSSVTVSVSGGGGNGLVYETGTWTPSEDIASYVISFANTHTEAPFYYLIVDATNSYSDTNNSNYFLEYVNQHQLTGAPIYESTTIIHYGEVRTTNRSGSATSYTNGTLSVTAPYTDPSNTSTTSSRYWATETGIKAYTNSTSRYWRANRTYKWIAVWKPTT